MKKSILLLILLYTVFSFGCKEDEELQQSKHSVSGVLLIGTTPVKDAEVDIDGFEQYKTRTDENGRFLIENVSTGICKLNASYRCDDESFAKRSFDININGDLQLNSLQLPNPVSISSVFDSATNKLTVQWDKSIADDFREYKLYSHTTAGLDENTGTLVHVSTDVNDTVIEIQLEGSATTYFRVFVLNDYGQLGGSNLIHVTSNTVNLFTYGDMESPDDFFSTWVIENGNISIVDSIQKNGNYCLFLNSMIDTAQGLSTRCIFSYPQMLLHQNEEYELSFWYKWKKGFSHDMYPIYCYYKQDGQQFLNKIITPPGEYIDFAWIYIEEDSEWTFFSTTFYPTSESSVQFFFEGNINELYFDDIQLNKVLR